MIWQKTRMLVIGWSCYSSLVPYFRLYKTHLIYIPSLPRTTYVHVEDSSEGLYDDKLIYHHSPDERHNGGHTVCSYHIPPHGTGEEGGTRRDKEGETERRRKRMNPSCSECDGRGVCVRIA